MTHSKSSILGSSSLLKSAPGAGVVAGMALLVACGSSTIPLGGMTAGNGGGGYESGSSGGGGGLGGQPGNGGSCYFSDWTSCYSGNGGGGVASQSAGGGGASSSGGGPGTFICEATFEQSIDKDCLGDDDCVLVQHRECCGTIVVHAITRNTDSFFTSAQTVYDACVAEQCAATMDCSTDVKTFAEDGSTVRFPNEVIRGSCTKGRCGSTVVFAP